ncbi:HD domain-containing phosphohydrolase [Marinospirillum sp.]|uniref:HD domain-containing phosphohydrolase n=1 Tax=Marinospirillum sp. TaxID=2183934 RepID=UPI003A85C250
MLAQPQYQKVAVQDLQVGMWICRMDVDTQDQPFETCALRYQHASQLPMACRHVYIDLQRSEAAKTSTQPPQRKFYLNLRNEMKRVMGDIRLGHALEKKRLRYLLEEIMQSVVHDSQNMVYLAMLHDHQDELVSKSLNVAILSLVFAKHIGLRQDQLFPLGQGALLHSMGLLQVPAQVLNKTAPLTEAEKELIREYPRRGYQYLLEQGGFDEQTLDIVLHHQERTNGEGYPDKLKGRQIGFLARMVAITSVYEALTRTRSYRHALTPTQALGQLYRWRFHDFDARLVEKFIHSLGVYPPGCLVELNDGALAVVHATHAEQRLNPQVRLLTRQDLEPLEVQHLIDLATDPQLSIKKTLDPTDPRLTPLLERIMAKHPGFPL